MNKSYQVFGVVVLGVVILLIFVVFVLKAKAGTDKMIEDSDCKASIEQHALLLKLTGEAVVPEIYCPTKYYTLQGKDDEQTKKELADAMKTCWGTWGRGQVNLFKEEGYYCHICSVIDFDNANNQIPGFSDYLINTPIVPGSSLKYVDYLAAYGSENADQSVIDALKQKGYSGTIDTSKRYVAIFVYAKGEGAIKSLLDNMDALGMGTIGGGITGGLFLGIGTALTIGLSFTPAVIVTAGLTIGGFVLGAANAKDVNWVSMTVLSEYNTKSLKEIGCEISASKLVPNQD